MKRFIFLALALAALAFWVNQAFAGRCVGGRCSIQSAPVETIQYWPRSGQSVWIPQGHAGQVNPSSATAPAGGVPSTQESLPTGVVSDKLSHGPSYIDMGGKTPATPASPLGAEGLPEDADKSYILAVGSKEFQEAARERIRALPQASQFHQGYFSPADWQVAGVGLDTPGITILGPKGKDGSARAVHFQSDLAGLEKAVDSAVGNLRKKLPDFDASKIPDLRNLVDGIKGRLLLVAGQEIAWPAGAALGLVGVGIAARRKDGAF